MNIGRATIVAVGVAAVMTRMGAGSVKAAVEPCAAEIEAVRTSISDAVFPGKSGEADRANLLAKVDSAAGKVRDGKIADAALKLQDVADAAMAQASAPKPKLVDASGITASVDAAIACLDAL